MTTTLIAPKDRRELVAERAKRFILDCLPGKELEIEIRQRKRERTPPQCRYLNGVAYKLLGQHTGYERDEISEYLCGSYFGWVEKKLPGGRTKQVPRRTTTTDENGKRDVLGRVPFGEYVAYVQRVGAKAGVYIPDPDPEWFKHEERKAA